MAPSSVTRVGTLDSGLKSSSAGSVVPTFQRSILASMPRAMAQFGVPMLRKQLARTPECAEVNIISSEDRDELGDGRKLTHVSTRPAEEMAAMPEATHPLVRTHPETGRKSLYLNPNRMERIVGLERNESNRLLDELIAHAIQPKYQYRHVWRQGDIVIWDNRCTMHKANADYPDGERRLMHRVIVAGTVPV